MNIEQSKLELEDVQRQIQLNKDELSMVNVNLSNIKASLSKGILPQKLYNKYMEARVEYIKSKNEKLSVNSVLKKREKELKEIIEIDYKKTYNESKSNKIVDLKNDINILKDKYFEFYRDKTRISSMRKMSQEFIIELDRLIKKIEL